MAIRSYRDLEVWQEGVRLAVAVVRMTDGMPREERFGYTSQLRRAAGSVAANVAEGYGRHTRQEYVRFLAIAHGSPCELETHLEVVRHVGWIGGATLDALDAHCARVGRLLAGLRRALHPRSPVPAPRPPISRSPSRTAHNP
jgi:four helix bundle protein